jgi:hypothetical protein
MRRRLKQQTHYKLVDTETGEEVSKGDTRRLRHPLDTGKIIAIDWPEYTKRGNIVLRPGHITIWHSRGFEMQCFPGLLGLTFKRKLIWRVELKRKTQTSS